MVIEFRPSKPAAPKPKRGTPPEAEKSKPADHPIERGRGRPPSGKEIVTMRLDADLLAYYRSQGKGWQAQVNRDLRKVAGPFIKPKRNT